MTKAINSVAGAFKIKAFTELPARGGGIAPSYPFKETNPGQMFAIPVPNDDKGELAKKVSTLASQSGKALGRKFAVRTIEEDGTPLVGVYCKREDDTSAEA